MQKIKTKQTCLAIILNWNELELTKRCIKSLTLHDNLKPDILVIDNNSSKNPENELQKDFKDILVFVNPENYGVAGGRNLGIKYALKKKYLYILLFDNDAIASSEMLEHLISIAKIKPNVGIFGPKILNLDKPKLIWRAGCYSWKWTYLFTSADILYRFFHVFKKAPPICLDKTNGYGQKDQKKYNVERNISFQIGCAQLIRADVFQDIGLLDDEFSPYGSEDIDFCSRATKAGWQIRYVPSAQCWHRDKSSYNDTYNRTYYNARNLLLLARKNLSPLFFLLVFLPDFVFLTIPLMFIQCMLKKDALKGKAFYKSLVWNIRDMKKRGMFI